MKSVYACTKPDGTLAIAINLIAMTDPKVIGAFLKLAGESNLTIDRVDPLTVDFVTTPLIRSELHELPTKQPELDFGKSDGGRVGPSEMGEGFSCQFSGPCPHENKSCSNCEYAGSIFQKTDNPPAEAATEGKPEGNGLVEEVENSPMMAWANEQMDAQEKAEQEAAYEANPDPLESHDPEFDGDGNPLNPEAVDPDSMPDAYDSDEDDFETPHDEPASEWVREEAPVEEESLF